MNKRTFLLGSIPVALGALYAGARIMTPKSDLDLLADSDLLLFPEDPKQERGSVPPLPIVAHG